MPRLRDPSNDPYPRDFPQRGSEDYELHSQGYGSRPLGAERGNIDSDDPDTPESSDTVDD